jgi:hypothetical protein
MGELQYDRKKKLGVVALLYLLVLGAIAFFYYTNTELDLDSILMELIKV